MTHLWQSTLHLRGDVVFVLGLALSIVVSVHVLLHKREVQSTVGWIGLAWIAPFTGTVAYFVFGVNRVQRRAQKLGRANAKRGRASRAGPVGDGHLEPLREGVRRITDRPLLGGNVVDMYQDGDEAYPPMLEAIGGAKRSVALSSYIFKDDLWGGHFIEALAAAKRRGAEVRVLIDGIGGGYLRSPAYHRLQREGVTSARFLHSTLPWRMPFLNLRSHKKMLVIDGTVGFAGGMNVGDGNVMATHPKKPVQDTHFQVRGPIVAQLMEDFALDWAFTTDEELLGDPWWPDIPEVGPVPARVVDSGPDEDVEKIEFAVLQAISCARTRIAVMTPYFLPDERLLTALSLARMRGVEVDIVIPQRSDHWFVDRAARANIGPVLNDGVRIWRSPPPFRHSKLMVVDNEWCLVGSCNWDIRSFRLNFESCVEFYDEDLAARLTALLESCRVNELTKAENDARNAPTRIRDAAMRLMLPYL